MQESVTKYGGVMPPYAECYLPNQFAGRFVKLTTKQDGNENPIMISLADIAVIQAEGILAGNTKIILRGSGKAIQIPMSYCDVTKKIFAAMETKAEDADPKKKPFVYVCNISFSENLKNLMVLVERNTNHRYGVVIRNDDSYVCIPLKHVAVRKWEPTEGEVKFINKDDVEFGDGCICEY
ncbi:MAG: hypothetical protein IJI57_04805 [Flexilinea sp.]|nr:hypothetical protein [Flexilinea sp.]